MTAPRLLPALLRICLGLFVFALSSLAFADDPEGVDEDKGRELAVEAMGHYGESEFDQALELFSEAEKVYPTGQVLRMKGYSLMALERWLEAADTIEKAIASEYKPLLPRDAEDAEDQLQKVLSHLSVVKMSTAVSDASVSVDGDEARSLPAQVRLLPGVHRFVVEAPGHETEEQQRTLQAGETDIAFELREIPKAEPVDPKPQPKPQPEEPSEPVDLYGWFPYQGYVGIATAGVGVILGGVALGTGIHGLSLRSAVQENIDVHNQNYGPNCQRESDLCRADIALINEDGARAANYQNAGMVTGIVGASLFATGAVLFFFSDESPFAPDAGPDENAPDSTSWACAPGLDLTGSGGVACGGTF